MDILQLTEAQQWLAILIRMLLNSTQLLYVLA